VTGGEGSHQLQSEWSQSVGLAGAASTTSTSTDVESAALSTLHLLPIKICRTALTPETDASINCTHGPACQSLGPFTVGRGTTAVWRLVWKDESERRERFVIWLHRSFPWRCTSQGPPPNHSCAAWCLLCRSIHALSASSTSECHVNFRVLDESRDLKFSYRNKILEN